MPTPPELVVACGVVEPLPGGVELDAPLGPDALALEAPASAAIAQQANIGLDTRKSLFRRPAGLAVGLALKEPAPPADSPRDSPRELGPPLRGFGNPRIRRRGNIHITVA
jgi:hypothetical protein